MSRAIVRYFINSYLMVLYNYIKIFLIGQYANEGKNKGAPAIERALFMSLFYCIIFFKFITTFITNKKSLLACRNES